MHTIKKPRGYIALISTLIIGAVATLIATSLILLGIGTSRSSFDVKKGMQARALANACAEEALQQIRSADSFNGTGNLGFDSGTCDYTVSQTGGENRSIIASGISQNMHRKVEIEVGTIYPKLVINKWLEY